VERLKSLGIKATLSLALLAFLLSTGLIFLALSAPPDVPAQKRSRPKPTPSPRRPLPKPIDSTRGFKQFAKREASSRLVVGAATRGADSAGALYEQAEAAYTAEKYQDAVGHLTEALKLRPDWAEAHYALALSLIELEQLEAAIREFRRVIELKPTYQLMILSNYNMGNLFLDLGKFPEAIDAYRKSIELNPDLPEIHNNLGLVYAAVNRIEDAVAEFSQAVKLRPDYAEAHFNLGVAYLQLGKKGEAEEQQRILLKLNAPLAAKLDDLIKQ
jgi:tetratricopeptide (TPR) repeat protein